MGWASGSSMAVDIWYLVKKHIPKKSRKRIARKLIDIFEFSDCDTIDEAEELCKDAGRAWDEETGEVYYK